MPMQSQPRMAEVLATARMTAFKPGQSPPPVTTPIRLLTCLLYCLCRQPGGAVFPDQCEALIDRVYAMRYGEIDFASEFVSFLKHRSAAPFDELRPHFADENKWCVVKFADLEELPRER